MNPIFQVAIATIFFGASGLFIKSAHLPPTAIAFFRFGVPAIYVLSLFLYRKQPLFASPSPLIFLASFLDALRILFYVIGFTYADMSTAVMILYTWPLFVMPFSSFFLKEKIPLKNLLLLPCFLIGIILIYADINFDFSSRDFIGLTSTLISAAIYAATTIIYKQKSQELSRTSLLFYQNFLGAIVFFPFLLFARPFPTLIQISWGATYGLLVGVIGFSLFFSALKQIKASTIAILCYLEVVSSIILGVVFFSEELTLNMLLGGSFILGGMFFLNKD